MVEPTYQEEWSARDAGFFEHLRALASSFVNYFQARLRLAGLESKEAFTQYLFTLIWILGAVVALFLGYIFIGVGLACLIAHLLKIHWMWTFLGVGILHVGVCVACALFAKSKMALPVFASTLSEFKKDQAWLNTPNSTIKTN